MALDSFGNYVVAIFEETPNYARGTCGGDGEGGTGQIKTYVTDPNDEAVVPDDLDQPAWAYQIDNMGPGYGWNPNTQTWTEA